MVGGYLTTAGRSPLDDLFKLIKDLELNLNTVQEAQLNLVVAQSKMQLIDCTISMPICLN